MTHCNVHLQVKLSGQMGILHGILHGTLQPAPKAIEMNEEMPERWERRSELFFCVIVCLFLFFVLFCFQLVVFKFSFSGEYYGGKGWIWRDWEISMIGCMVWNPQRIDSEIMLRESLPWLWCLFIAIETLTKRESRMSLCSGQTGAEMTLAYVQQDGRRGYQTQERRLFSDWWSWSLSSLLQL